MPTKVHLVKAMVFPIIMYGCESRTIKKTEQRRNDAFELWCWRRLLRVPWTARRSNQSILKEVSPEYSLEGQMLKQKLPILWPPDAENWLIWEDPDAWNDSRWGEKETTDGWIASLTPWNMSLSKLQELVMDREAWHIAVHGVTKSQTRLSNWAELWLFSLNNLKNYLPTKVFSIKEWKDLLNSSLQSSGRNQLKTLYDFSSSLKPTKTSMG